MSLIHGQLERTRDDCTEGMVQGSTGAGLEQPLAIPAPTARQIWRVCALVLPWLILTQMLGLSVSSPGPVV